MRIVVTLPADDWVALLCALPRCVECGTTAELDLGGRPRCCSCAGPGKVAASHILTFHGRALAPGRFVLPGTPPARCLFCSG